MEPRLVSVILVTWNSAPYLRRCLDGLRQQTHRSVELIVIDNASSDDSAALVASDAAKLIRNEANRGFSAAVNQGIAAARGEYVLLLNPDCHLTPTYLERLLEAMETASDVGSATGMLLRATGPNIEPTGGIDSLGMRMTRTGRHLDITTDHRTRTEAGESRGSRTTNPAIPRAAGNERTDESDAHGTRTTNPATPRASGNERTDEIDAHGTLTTNPAHPRAAGNERSDESDAHGTRTTNPATPRAAGNERTDEIDAHGTLTTNPAHPRAAGNERTDESDAHGTPNKPDTLAARPAKNHGHGDVTADHRPPTTDHHLAEVFGVSGAAALHRTAFLHDVAIDGEVLDEDFFAYREDADLAWRGRLFGWRALCDSRAIAYHVRRVTPEARKALPADINMHSVKNRFLLRLKNQGAYLALRNAPFELARDLIVLLAALTVERTSLPAFAWLWRHRARVLAKRRIIQQRRKVSDRELARWFR